MNPGRTPTQNETVYLSVHAWPSRRPGEEGGLCLSAWMSTATVHDRPSIPPARGKRKTPRSRARENRGSRRPRGSVIGLWSGVA